MSVVSYKFSIGGYTLYRSRLSTRLFGGTSMRIVKGPDLKNSFSDDCERSFWQDVEKDESILCVEPCSKMVSECEELVSSDFSCVWREKLRKAYSRAHVLDRKKAFSKAMAYAELDRSKKFLAFYSISFPLGTSDRDAVSIFNICRTRLKRDAGLSSWLRICERQKNGTIHFHMLTNCWIDIEFFNHVFSVAIKNKLGYSGFYNGVDVEGLTGDNNRRIADDSGTRARRVAYYLSKYISKESTPFSCSPYSCSRDVSRLATSVSVFSNPVALSVVDDCSSLGSEGYGSKCVSSEYATITTWPRFVDLSTGEITYNTFWDRVIYRKFLLEFNNIVFKCKDCIRALSLLMEKMCLNIGTFLSLTGSRIISCEGWDFALSI